MPNPKTTRVRRADRRADTPELERAPAVDGAQPPPAGRAAATVPAAPTAPAAPRLDTDDLMALANMDASELAALMEGAVAGDALEIGASVKGVVTRVDPTAVLVDIGGKAEAWVEREELPDAVMGDAVEAFVVHTTESEVKLSKRLSGAAAGAFLDEAYTSQVPVEGRVMSANAGGFEVRVGDARAFCPISLIARHYVEEPAVFVGQTLEFLVIEVGDKVVLSRRALQEQRAEKSAEELWDKVFEGMELDGTVRNVQSFGAFVDLGGVDGLVPASELSWDRGVSPADVVRVGETVSVRVIGVDRDSRKLTLSLKRPDDAPWRRVGSEFMTGGVYEGVVARTAPFGLFVRLADGLDGLLHVSRLGDERPEVGAKLQVRVLGIDDERQRIALGLATGEQVEAAERVQVTGRVAEVLRNGVVVQLDDGRDAWLPEAEVELPGNVVLSQRFRPGREVTAWLKESGRRDRVTLTLRPQSDDDWRAAAPQKPATAGSFGTLGDLFKGIKLGS